MQALLTAAQMREIDRATIEGLGLPGAVLMEYAGRAVADEVALVGAKGRVAVLCGPGNNGGDGYVCARWLREWGIDAQVFLAAARPRAGGDAALFLAVYEKLGGPVVELATPEALRAAHEGLLQASVIVDALLGTGLKSDVHGHLADVIAVVNTARAVKVAVDLPSGMDGDTGRIWGVAIKADRTVTFGFAKVGQVSAPGFELCGALRVAEIGIPAALARRHGASAFLLDHSSVLAKLPVRVPTSHKGTHGHLLVVAGSPGKSGAALLCASAALRAGAGLCTLATMPALRPSLEGRVPEVMLAEFDGDAPPEGALAALSSMLGGKRALAWGPGMSTSPEAGEVLRAAVRTLPVPTVLDADALNHVARDLACVRGARAPIVLTPHPGEAARLLHVPIGEVTADRVGAARKLAAESGAVVVLKGARTVIARPDGVVAINPTGNPAMGTAGTGDVLTGVIGGLLAQGLPSYDAAFVGTYLHGRAGDRVASRLGGRGLLAGDLVAELPAALGSDGSSRG
jgi:NAD(P)H-hydrate epimerase